MYMQIRIDTYIHVYIYTYISARRRLQRILAHSTIHISALGNILVYKLVLPVYILVYSLVCVASICVHTGCKTRAARRASRGIHMYINTSIHIYKFIYVHINIYVYTQHARSEKSFRLNAHVCDYK